MRCLFGDEGNGGGWRASFVHPSAQYPCDHKHKILLLGKHTRYTENHDSSESMEQRTQAILSRFFHCGGRGGERVEILAPTIKQKVLQTALAKNRDIIVCSSQTERKKAQSP